MCLLGVLLCFLCLTVPALTLTGTRTYGGIVDVKESNQYMTTDRFANLVLPSIVFFLGFALAFVTPLGGVGMALGMIGYYYGPSPQFNPGWSIPYPIVLTFHWGPAFYIGILAAIVTLASFVFPIGPGYSEMYRPWPLRRGHLKERLLVWGRSK
jgi:hypothetical protein